MHQSFNEDLPTAGRESPAHRFAQNGQARKSPRQVVIPVARDAGAAYPLALETPFMRKRPEAPHQNSVGDSINSGTSINEEESRGVSSFHI
jgi:hypothetical protein